MKPREAMPATYDGREQAYAKHVLLESYLGKLVMIIGQSLGAKRPKEVEITFVDCFAGPWQSNDPELGGTSISLSLRILRRRLGIRGRGRTLAFRRAFRAPCAAVGGCRPRNGWRTPKPLVDRLLWERTPVHCATVALVAPRAWRKRVWIADWLIGIGAVTATSVALACLPAWLASPRALTSLSIPSD